MPLNLQEKSYGQNPDFKHHLSGIFTVFNDFICGQMVLTLIPALETKF